jgi:hypothetical protein
MIIYNLIYKNITGPFNRMTTCVKLVFILQITVSRPEKAVTRYKIFANVWGDEVIWAIAPLMFISATSVKKLASPVSRP